MFFLVSHAVWDQMANESDAVVDWLMDQSEVGGGSLLSQFPEPIEGRVPVSFDLDTLYDQHRCYMSILAELLRKFDFGFYVYYAPYSCRVGYTPCFQKQWRDYSKRYGPQFYLCDRHGDGPEVWDLCTQEGCLPLRLQAPSCLRAEDLGPHLRHIMTSPLTIVERLSLAIMIACSYIGVMLRSTRVLVSDRVATVARLCLATYSNLAHAVSTE
ncbi:hypothetical protein EDB81DRAFT_426491 [Dactylonectria macrodidyma]|uniref:Uncharacterized protein n=1 Tax=Dactylonectria macrodidyma TaxID=307937 RepID=A0A9P9CZ75_9HYPO|nr:hypothetical protein EDB81DRAFT_426491 [Dactylonectria macrodidyma]